MKNAILKILAKVENVNIPILWGYSLASFMLAFFLLVRIAQIDVRYGGGEEIVSWSYLSIVLFWASLTLFALTKKTKYFGLRIARVSAIVFALATSSFMYIVRRHVNTVAGINTGVISDVFFALSGVAGYFLGKHVGRKIEKLNLTSTEQRQVKAPKKNILLAGFKEAVYSLLYKLENLSINPFVGYALVLLLILPTILKPFWLRSSEKYTYSIFFDFICFWVAMILFAITKRTKYFGARLARIFAVISVFAMSQLWRIIPSEARMYGDCYIDPMDFVLDAAMVVIGFLGYLIGKTLGSKLLNKNIASMKIESSQG